MVLGRYRGWLQQRQHIVCPREPAFFVNDAALKHGVLQPLGAREISAHEIALLDLAEAGVQSLLDSQRAALAQALE